MSAPQKQTQQLLRTKIVEGPLARRMAGLNAARRGQTGLQVLTLPQVAARLAGGFIRPAQSEDLEPALRRALADGQFRELTPLAELPGMVRALVATLGRLWTAGHALSSDSGEPRLADLALIDGRVRETLGPTVLTPPDLAVAALARIQLAEALIGPVEIAPTGWIAPVWRSLVEALRQRGLIIPEETPPDRSQPATTVSICADLRSEVVEALRWARELVASGRAKPEEIAIAAAAPAGWDEAMSSLVQSSGLPVHISHGVSILATVDGQACAALAELLGQGLSQERVRRWLAHSAGRCAGLEGLAVAPLMGINAEAHLGDVGQWRQAVSRAEHARSDGARPGTILVPALELLAQGWPAAQAAGARLLPTSARRVWEAALRAAPAETLPHRLADLRVADGQDPGANIVWCPASHLAGAPRPFVRLLGLTAGGWPRPMATDPLLPDHVLALDRDGAPSRPERDRRAFALIRAHAQELGLSYGRRNAQGGLQAPSPLLPDDVVPVRLARQRAPEHAFSEADRLAARLDEARMEDRFAQANACWTARSRPAAGPYDGLVQANHPAILRALSEPQSATSLRRLLRDPLGYVWRYALGWRSTVPIAPPLELDPRAFGDLVHQLLQHTVSGLEPVPGFGRAEAWQVEEAVTAAGEAVFARWPVERVTPPALLWRYTIETAKAVALRALRLDPLFAEGTRSWTEVRFGDPDAAVPADGAPWNPRDPVPVPGSSLNLRGAIDRLELDAGDVRAQVTDYKTGAAPRQPERVVLGGGAELQRVLYAIAVEHHRPDTRVLTRLIFLSEPTPRPYPLRGDELKSAIAEAVRHLNAAVALLSAGTALPGRDDPWEDWNALRLALPASGEPYRRLKAAAFGRAFGAFEAVWRTR
jgi:hypothetical protein